MTAHHPTIVSDPRRQFGQPCVAGTRVPAAILAEHVWADEGLDEVAAAFNVDRLDVAWCCAWWMLESFGPEPGKRWKKNETATRLARWQSWAQHVIGVLGGHHEGVIGEPDDYEVTR